MKKNVAFLLACIMLLSLCSCVADDKINAPADSDPDDVNSNSETNMEEMEDTEEEKETEIKNLDFPKQGDYYRIEKVEENRVKYYFYGLDGRVAHFGEADSSFHISKPSNYLLCITEGKNRQYYDVANNRFSKIYSKDSVRGTSENIVIYLRGDVNNYVLVAESLFDDTFYKEFALDFKETANPIRSLKVLYGRIYLSYDAKDRTERNVILPLFEAGYDFFVDYSSIQNLIHAVYAVCEHTGNYETDFSTVLGITDAQQVEWCHKLVQSAFLYSPPQLSERQRVRGSVRDLNGDDVYELIVLNEGYDVIAIFTTVDGSPVLLDHFGKERICEVDHEGSIHVIERESGGTYSREIFRLPRGGGSLEPIITIGCNVREFSDGSSAKEFYKVENGQTIVLTQEEYDDVINQHFSMYGMTRNLAKLRFLMGGEIAQACAKQAFVAVLQNKMKVYNTETDEYCYFKDCKAPYIQVLLSEESNLGYAHVDVDCDGVTELVIHCGDMLLLRYYKGTVYLYPFVLRDSNLNTDGSYGWHHMGQDFEYGEDRIFFDGWTLKSKNLWRIVNDGSPNAEFYIHGVQVTEAEALLFFEENPKKKVDFSPLEVPFEKKISREEAMAIANAYWGDIDGVCDAACGTFLTLRITVQDEYYDDFGYYHVIAYWERRRSWEDHTANSTVRYISDSHDLFVHVVTGECQPYVINYGK